ncbi:MAG: peptidoglycan DD-metalloendopeptidase family protein [Acidobacteriota bacterium]|nr:peptidoglycan DD-metalloendopeptidase family protein [Acidobacteriota bacterium]
MARHRKNVLHPKNLLRFGVALALLITGLWLHSSTTRLQAETEALSPLAQAPRFDATLARHLPHPQDSASFDTSRVPLIQTFAPGETLGTVLARFGVEGAPARELGATLADHVDLRRLRAGDPYSVFFDEQGQLEAFQVAVANRGRIRIERAVGDSGWRDVWHPFERRVHLQVISGELEGSLEGSIQLAGGPATLAYRMADALQWDLDFTRDLRLGDRFQALYEHVYLDGQDRGPGKLLALRYETRGSVLEAFAFGEDGGYYDGEGRPLRKMFLRSPMRYSRVTSQFTHRRFHPVLKVYRPHYGVDYGAPRGTPVRVTASGTVSFAGWNRGGGRTIKVRHPNDYETAYLHLSKFADGIRPGRRVTQGQVIGFVGSTGLSTAPHLDYRVKHHGRYLNPLNIKSVPARPIAQKDLPEYIDWRDVLRRSLESGTVTPLETAGATQLASLRSTPEAESATTASSSQASTAR